MAKMSAPSSALSPCAAKNASTSGKPLMMMAVAEAASIVWAEFAIRRPYPSGETEKRMSDYNDVARVYLRHPVISVAILGDEDPDWNPEIYHWQKGGCELTFKFKLVK